MPLPILSATIAAATGLPVERIEKAWPVIVAALEGEGISSFLVQVATAATLFVECRFKLDIREQRANPSRNPKVYALQERYWPSGFYGRGPIQLTWEKNYRHFSQRLGVDLISNPDRALEPAIGAAILAAYFKDNGVHLAAEARDWPKVRRLVNGPGMLHYKEFLSLVQALLER